MGLVLEGDYMWLVYACGSALFAGITSILAKCGIKKTDSTVATALRTIVVLIFAWLMVFIVGSQNQISSISTKSFIFWHYQGLRRVQVGFVTFMLYRRVQLIKWFRLINRAQFLPLF